MSDKVNWDDFTPVGQTTPAKTNEVDWSQFEPAKPSGALRRGIADKALGFASGAVGATKALADVAGAGNAVSNTLDEANKGINEYLSPEAKADQQEQSALMDSAKGKGAWEGVKAGAKAFAVAPVQTAVQGLGSIVPIIAGTAVTGGAAPAAAVGAGIGAAMGAGTAKGAIYDEIKKRGGTEEEAIKAQEYGGANTDQIALGGALGTADALTGVSKMAGNMVRGALRKPVTEVATKAAERGIVGRAGMGMLSEMPLEAAQGGQEQVAANLAAQRAGYEAGTWDNVASNATLEALASAGPGAAFGAMDTSGRKAQQPPPAVPQTTPPATPPNLSVDPVNLAAVQSEEMGNPDVQQTTAPDGRAILAAQQEKQRLQSEAEIAANRAVAGPDDEILASTGAVDPIRAPIQYAAAQGGALSGAALVAIDTGAHQAHIDQQASEADQAAYDAHMAEKDTTDKPITTGKIAESAMSDEDKRAVLFSNQPVVDGGKQWAGTQDGDVLNGMGAPFPTWQTAMRRAKMEGKDWTIAPVFDGFVARRKYAKESTDGVADKVLPTNPISSGQDGNIPADSVGNGAATVQPGTVHGTARKNDSVGQSGERAGGALRSPVAQGKAQPTQLGKQTNAKAGPGFTAKDVQGVQNQQAAANDTKAEQAPVEASAAVEGNAATPDNVPGAGSATVATNGIDAAAHESATSNLNDKPQPTEAQKIAGNYPKGHVSMNGLDLSIENPAGSERSGTDKDGKPWSVTMQHHYGYIKGTVGNDKDHFDLFIKPGTPLNYAGPVYIVDQVHPHNGKFDEHKAMVGFKSLSEAEAAYQSNYAKGWKGAQGITSMLFPDFKTWVKDGPKNKPLTKAKPVSQPKEQSSEKTTEAVETKSKQQEAPAAAGVKPKKPSLKQRMDDERKARANYFTPGNIVQSYGGIDEVLSYTPPNDKGEGWSVKVHAVKKVDGQWIRIGKPQDARTHSTHPEAQALKAGPIARLGYQPAGEVVYSETRADGQAFPNAVDRGTKPEIVVDKAEMRPYRKPDGSVGYEAVPIVEDKQETGDFGPILTQFKGDAQGAIRALTELQDGEAVAALNHPEVGDIDLVWGTAGTKESNGSGLAKLVKWHPEVVNNLQEVISSLKVVDRTENRIQLESDTHKAAVRLEWNGVAKKWLLTAFEKRVVGSGTTTDTTADGVEGDTARLKSDISSVATPAPEVKANTIFTEDAAAAARARLKSKLGRLNSGIDPEMLMDGIILSGYHIEKGARTFAAYAKAMIDDLGDGVKPYLKSWYMATKYDPRASNLQGMDDQATMDAVNLEKLENTEDKAESSTSSKPSLNGPEGRHAIAQSVADHFIGGGKFDTIIQARKFISELTGEKIESSSKSAKLADETIEMGVVLAGREIVKAGRNQKRSDQTIYDRLVSLYNAQPNLSVRSSTSVEQQAYSTPIPLAFVASRLAKIKKGDIVAEPTAGNSALVLEVAPGNTIINELNDDRIANLKVMGFTPTQKNAATEQLAAPKSVDAAVMNPPFGAVKDGEGKTIYFDVPAGPNTPALNTREIDHAIVFNSLSGIKDDGRAVLIVGGVDASNEDQIRDGYRGKGKREFYYKLYNEYKVTDHFTVDGGLYSRQGAGYPVDVIVIDGRGKSVRDLPAANLPQRIMSYDQLKEKLNEANTLVPAGSGTGVRVGSDPTGVSHGTDVATSSIGAPDGPGIEGAKPSQSIQADGAGDGVRPLLGQSTGGGAVSGGGQLGIAGASAQPDATVRGGLVAPAGVDGRSGRKTGNGGNKSDDVGRDSPLDGKLVGSGLTDRRGQEAETENQVGYTPKSGKASVGTLVPVNMRDAIQESLSKVADDVGDLDTYVAKALGYTSQELGDYLSAEQIDALALAIYNAEQGKGFIIGDQTGIGKGRVNAAMIRYAIKKGQVPIFITEKPNLYADMIRDLDDIGMAKDLDLEGGKPHILMTNNGESIPYELYRNVNGEVVEHRLTLKAPKSNAKDAAALLAEFAGNGELGRYKVIFSTYSQLQSISGKATERQRFLTAFAKDNFIIFDESHNAGGTGEAQDSRSITKVMKAAGMTVPGRAGFARNLVKLAKGTFFSSATYAKRPDVMDLYSSTNMSLAVDKPADLATAIKAGGVPLQQAVATMLTADGQYIRRERTFAGVSYETQLMPIDRKTGENMAESMRWILAFSRAKEALLAQMQKEFDKDGAIAQNMGGEKTQVAGANFGSVMHNLIDQMLLALKVEESVKLAIAKLKSGEKVVLTVSNTMGSFLKDYADEMGIRPGDAVSLSFKDLYLRYLDKQRKYKVKSPGGTVEEKYLTDAELGHLLPMHNKIQAFIQNAGFGSAPISPIDYMHNELRKAGYKTDEITGRTATVDYEGGIAKLASRTANIKQRLKAIGDFNSGAADVLILNQSGSTGLSLHASAKFKDQKKRHMIIVQAEKNIDTHMQMLGRVHRTGQVVTPGYTQAMADTPAEMRPAAVLSKKMAGLSANTTASRKSAVSAEGVVDFINEYGGQVAAEFLLDNPEVHDALGGQRRIEVPSDLNEAGEELIRKLTGYIPILPLKQQEQIYADLIERYNDLIARENSMGTNKLETKALDLDAKTLTSEKITANKGSATETSVFAEPANMEQVDVKRNVKPLTPQELEAAINETLNRLTPQQYNTSIAKEFDADLAKYVADVLEKMAVTTDNHALVQGQKKDQLFLMGQNIKRILSIYKVGDSVTITDKNASVVHGVITGITHNQKTKNPAAGSAWKMTFALANGDARTMSVGFGQLGQQFSVNVTPGTVPQITADGKIDRVMIRSLFENGNNIRREKRWMVTGNLLAGFSKYQGQIVSYTKADGGTGQGVLMNRQFDYKKEKGASTLSFSTSEQAIEFLSKAGRNAVLGSPDRVLRIVSLGGERYSVMVPSSKREGGSLYLDRGLLEAFGTDFYKQGQNMSMRIDGNDTLERGLKYLLSERDDISLAALTNQDVARKVLGMDDQAPAMSRSQFSRPTFSRGAQSQANESVERLANGIASHWENAPKIVVAFDMNDPIIPDNVRKEDQRQRSGGATGTPEGFYYKGTVYLMSSKLGTPDDIARVLFHEALGHYGLRGLFGRALKPVLNEISMRRRAEVDAKIKQYGLKMGSKLDRMTAAEEVLAELAQTRPDIGIVQRAIAAIRTWLRENVPGLSKLSMTDAEIIRSYILPARAFVERSANGSLGGRIEPTFDQGTVFSRSIGDTLTNAANSARDVNLPAGYKVGDLFNSAPGKLNWWYKTVGTQYNLAQRSPAFKRVYDAVQTFINDVSYFATEAADLAPNILPKLESWKDIAKSPLSAADTKALSTPVFEGTLNWSRDESGKPVKMDVLESDSTQLTTEQKAQRLLRGDHISQNVLKMWQGLPIEQYEKLIESKYKGDMLKAGIVFTPAELKALFNLNDKQVSLYQEFRKATDKSLTNLAIADMIRFGGKDVDPIREQVLESKTVGEAAEMLRDYLLSVADDNDVLTDTANKMIDKANKAQDLMDRGYAPLSRFGTYTLDVVDADGERAYFGMFESAAEASKMRRKMEGLYPGSAITQGTVSEEAYKMFAGVSPETLELFGDMLGLESQGDGAASQAFQEYLKLAKSSRSAMKRLIQRKGIAGFSEDAGRVLAGFVYSNARQTASSLHMGEMTNAANDISQNQGELKDAAVKLVDYIKNPREEAQALRGLLFAQYIGGSVASAMVNMTQPFTMTFPWLSQYGGVSSAAKQMTSAMKDAGKKLTGDTRLDAALKRAEEDGTVSPQEVHQLMQQSQGKGALQSGDGTRAGDAMAKANNALSKVSLAWGKLFGVAEQFNRRVTFIAAYRTAVAQGIANPDAFARKAIAETQGVYNKGNKPAWARGAVGSTLFTFKQYSIAYIEMLSRMAKNGPEGKKAALLALGVLFLMAGAGGMPGADDLDDVISGVMQSMGYNFDSKMKRKEFFVSILGEGGAQFMERGISGLPGVPIDVSGRLGLGNLVPGTGLFTKKADHTRDVAEIAGPMGDFAKRGFDAAGKLITGDVGGAVNSVSPKALQNLTQAYDMANMGMYRDAKGMKVLSTDGTDALVKAIGFQPNDVKRAQDANFEQTRMIGLNKINETDIANRWAMGIFEKDAGKIQEARDDLAEWNRANPESPIRINFAQIRSRVQKMNQTKAERIEKTAPKEIRAAVRQELAASR